MDVLIGTRAGLHELRGGEVRLLLPEVEISALARDGAACWILTDGATIWRFENGSVAHTAAVEPLAGTCLLPTPEGLLVGTSEAHLLRLDDGTLSPVDAFDRAPGRDTWYTPWGGPPDTRSLARDVGGMLLANVHVGGIVRSRDGGASWEPTVDIDADVHQVLAHDAVPGRAFAACAEGLAETTDGGGAWGMLTDGLHATYSRAVAIAGDSILLTASEGHVGHHAAVYWRPLGGGAFERCRAGLPEWFEDNIDSHCLAAAGSSAAFGTDGGELFVSGDEGRTWKLHARDLPPVRCVALGVA